MAARMPMMPTTIITSMRVKPDWRDERVRPRTGKAQGLLMPRILRTRLDGREPYIASPAPLVEPHRIAGLTRQVAGAHQVFVDRTRRLPAFADRPHHQRLAAAHVARREHLVDAGAVAARLFGAGPCVSARVLLDAEHVQHAAHRRHETPREQPQVARQALLA